MKVEQNIVEPNVYNIISFERDGEDFDIKFNDTKADDFLIHEGVLVTIPGFMWGCPVFLEYHDNVKIPLLRIPTDEEIDNKKPFKVCRAKNVKIYLDINT